MTDEDKPGPCPFYGKSESYVTDVGHRWFQVVCECGARRYWRQSQPSGSAAQGSRICVNSKESAERERCAKMLDQRASELEIEFPNGGAVARIHELVEQAKRIREGGHA